MSCAGTQEAEAIQETREASGEKCINLRRSGYEAYVRTTTPTEPGFIAVHKHYHEEHWRVAEPNEHHLRRDMNRMDWSIVETDDSPFRNPDMEVELDE